MFSDKVAPQNLNTKRLDSDFYRPEYIEIDNTLSNLNCVKLGTIGKFFTGPFGSLLPSNLYLNEGIPLFRVGNVGQFEALSENFAYLAPSVHGQLKVSEVVPGDLLLVKASVGEKICKVPEWLPKANITQHIIGIRPNQSKDTDYISAFLFCYYGVGQLQRYSLGSIIQYLGITDAKDVNLYSPDPLVQKYIGDKVRQAEKLRAWAKRLEVRLALLENQIPISKHVVREAKHSKATLSHLTENRLDARYYANKHLDLYAQFTDDFESLGSICSKFKYGASIAANYVNTDGLPFIRGNALSPNIINKDDIVYLNRSLEDEGNNYCIEEDDILITRSGTVGVAAHVTSEYAKYWYGSFIIKCTLSNKLYLSAYVSWYLNSWVGQQQFRRLENGAVQLNINIEELSSIAIWKASQEFQNEIQQLLFEQISAVNLSKLLTNTAKTLVEALIEGQLTEQQLIQAQQALEDGDNSLDQVIISKLSAEGYAIEGATPLFSDVDELYSLLEDAAQAEAEE